MAIKIYTRITCNMPPSKAHDVPDYEQLTVTVIDTHVSAIYMGTIDVPSYEYGRNYYKAVVRQDCHIVELSYTYYKYDMGPIHHRTIQLVTALQAPMRGEVEVRA